MSEALSVFLVGNIVGFLVGTCTPKSVCTLNKKVTLNDGNGKTHSSLLLPTQLASYGCPLPPTATSGHRRLSTAVLQWRESEPSVARGWFELSSLIAPRALIDLSGTKIYQGEDFVWG